MSNNNPPVGSVATNAAQNLSVSSGDAFIYALTLHRQGKLPEAESWYRFILKRDPSHFQTVLHLGILYCDHKDAVSAIPILKDAVRLQPESVDAHAQLGRAYKGRGQYQQALRCMERTVELRPDFAAGHNECGIILTKLDEPERAIECYQRALALQPNYMEALYNYGNSLVRLDRHEEALNYYDRALAINPKSPDALHNRANVLVTLQHPKEALESYELAAQYNPAHVGAHLGCAKMQVALHQPVQALARYQHCTQLAPNSAEAWHGAASMLLRLSRPEEACQYYQRAAEIDPKFPGAFCMQVFSAIYCCDWTDCETRFRRVYRDLFERNVWTPPWLLLTTSDNPKVHLGASQLWVKYYAPPSPKPLWRGERYHHDRIRIAYLSADFHMHATAMLIAGVFEHHDKSKFEIIAISFGPNIVDEMRTRLMAAFDRFIDVTTRSDLEVAQLMREMEIDIAVDLKGHTSDSRQGILAHRPAPIQVNYLGYPGSMGAPYIQYIIADRTIVPPEHEQFYSEKVICLPNTYQCNDRKRYVPASIPTREQVGLPESGFVFCSFNNNFKITPQMFDIWMRLLKEVAGSVLWLLQDNPAVAKNLRREAERRGVDSNRLVFAPRVPTEEHIARHTLADLFLDTIPCNAHTTASDALWAGLPIVTCLGDSFAGRVCASLLYAIEMPELVAESMTEYESLAVQLAKDPGRLTSLRDRLRANRDCTALFDTERFTCHLEGAYMDMLHEHASSQEVPQEATSA